MMISSFILQVVKAENERLKRQVVELENKQPGGTVAGKGKKNKQEDDVLAKAKLLLFEKTKVCKQQEQQLKAIKAQMDATKDVLDITKEMLNLRNAENLHFQARFDTMELRLKSERDRLEITIKKLELSQKMYNDIKGEYEVQNKIFKVKKKLNCILSFIRNAVFLQRSTYFRNCAKDMKRRLNC